MSNPSENEWLLRLNDEYSKFEVALSKNKTVIQLPQWMEYIEKMQAYFQSFEPTATALKSSGHPKLSQRLEEVMSDAKAAGGRFKEQFESAAAALQKQSAAKDLAAGGEVKDTASPGPGADDLGAEIVLNIPPHGDRRYAEPGWAGTPGGGQQIEAMSLRPREGGTLPQSAIEFRAFVEHGISEWASDGRFVGSRGRGLALTGFMARPTPRYSDQIEVVYEGCFIKGGVVGPKRDGDICVSPIKNDPLEAIRVNIYRKTSKIEPQHEVKTPQAENARPAIEISVSLSRKMGLGRSGMYETLEVDVDWFACNGNDLKVKKGEHRVTDGKATLHSALIGDFVVDLRGKGGIDADFSPAQLQMIHRLPHK